MNWFVYRIRDLVGSLPVIALVTATTLMGCAASKPAPQAL